MSTSAQVPSVLETQSASGRGSPAEEVGTDSWAEERPQSPALGTSRVMIFDVSTRRTTLVLERPGIVEAPNWSRDGSYLLVNAAGQLLRCELDRQPRTLRAVPLVGGPYVCNNDHDLSPDGRLIAFSASSPSCEQSRVYLVGAAGGAVRLVTAVAPSYFHGWSPDGQWLAFVAERGDGRYELYRVRAADGAEERLTSTGGYDDGPEYHPGGRHIYFNSNRGGRWNIWRMPPTGAGEGDQLAEQVTADAPEDWFPHLSPDGKWLLMISFPPGTTGHDDRMPGMMLRLMPTPGPSPISPIAPETLLVFSGGQGSLNVNSWSPDSTRFAFVAYEPAEHAAL